jgi:uncharacterized membrane protein YcgQ (UPF0703/DUF1980 family)
LNIAFIEILVVSCCTAHGGVIGLNLGLYDNNGLVKRTAQNVCRSLNNSMSIAEYTELIHSFHQNFGFSCCAAHGGVIGLSLSLGLYNNRIGW